MHKFKHCEIDLGPEADKLSKQQCAIVVLLALGMTNRAIARCINRSPATVKMHVDALMAIFNVSNRAGIVGQAFCHGVLKPAGRTLCAFLLGFVFAPPLTQTIDDRSPLQRIRTVRVTRSGRREFDLSIVTGGLAA